jgi:nucleoside-diphosphate-sugar epimerase
MLKLLYTGASGFLGSNTIPGLKHIGYNITTVGSENTDVVCDLSSSIPELSETYDIVFHAAGKAHIEPKNDIENKLFFDVNFQGTVNICKALENLSKLPSAFIFISTVAVYGLDSGEMITEEQPLKGSTPYAKSKIMAEEWLTSWAANNGVILTILRLPLVAGYNPPGNLRSMINGIKTGKYLSIGKANARKSIIWAQDIADVVPLLTSIGGIYNITDGHHPSFGELETVIARALNKKKPVTIPIFLAILIAKVGDILGRRAPINSHKLKKITSSLTFDDKKLHDTIQWEPSAVTQKLSQSI